MSSSSSSSSSSTSRFGNGTTTTTTTSRCAACKSLRRKCPQDCILAPYFPSTNQQRFASVHKIFGASNVTKMLQQLPEELRREAAECVSYEAMSRVRDPVYGCVGVIHQLQHEINQTQIELMKIKGELAFYRGTQQQQTTTGLPPDFVVGP